ncbi:Pentatricopeptide repeat-containing protein, partial [Drosera capensis]
MSQTTESVKHKPYPVVSLPLPPSPSPSLSLSNNRIRRSAIEAPNHQSTTPCTAFESSSFLDGFTSKAPPLPQASIVAAQFARPRYLRPPWSHCMDGARHRVKQTMKLRCFEGAASYPLDRPLVELKPCLMLRLNLVINTCTGILTRVNDTTLTHGNQGDMVPPASLFNQPVVDMVGEMLYAQMFGASQNLYAYPNSYHLIGNSSPMLRRQEIQAEKSLGTFGDDADGVKPDNYSYRICINSFGVRSDIEGMEEILKEMEIQPHIAMDWNTYAVAAHIYMKAGLTAKASDALQKAEVRLDEEKDGESYNFLISLYAKLGNRDEVLRLWKLEKSACNRCINRDYITVLKAMEWEDSRNSHDLRVPDVLIASYWGNGLFEKAKEVIEELASKGKACSPKWTSLVAKGSTEKVDIEEALDDESEAHSLMEEK